MKIDAALVRAMRDQAAQSGDPQLAWLCVRYLSSDQDDGTSLRIHIATRERPDVRR